MRAPDLEQLLELAVIGLAYVRPGADILSFAGIMKECFACPIQKKPNDRLLTAKDRPDLALMVYTAGTQMALDVVVDDAAL